MALLIGVKRFAMLVQDVVMGREQEAAGAAGRILCGVVSYVAPNGLLDVKHLDAQAGFCFCARAFLWFPI